MRMTDRCISFLSVADLNVCETDLSGVSDAMMNEGRKPRLAGVAFGVAYTVCISTRSCVMTMGMAPSFTKSW